jgi:hypothetical protein
LKPYTSPKHVGINPEKLFSARSNKWRENSSHISSGMLPVNEFPRSNNSLRAGIFLFISFGMDPKSLLFVSERVVNEKHLWKTKDKSVDRLLLLSSRMDRKGNEHIEVGIPPTNLLLDRSMTDNLFIPIQDSGISPVK